MAFLYAIVMGLIQGVTEFLPVSSSGHLAICKTLFHIEEPGLFFDVLLHVGTLIAVFLCFWRDIVTLLQELIGMIGDCFYNLGQAVTGRGQAGGPAYRRIVDNSYRKFDLLLLTATIPTGVIGIWDRHLVEKLGSLLPATGICLCITGVILLLADRIPEGDHTPRSTTYASAFLVGIAQGVATLPGISRSGSTIAACLACGFKKSYAVRFSFLLSIPAILGSLVFELGDVELSEISGVTMASYFVGMAVAFAVGFICIRLMLFIVRRRRFWGFSIYCFAVGALSIIGGILIR